MIDNIWLLSSGPACLLGFSFGDVSCRFFWHLGKFIVYCTVVCIWLVPTLIQKQKLSKTK